MRHTHSLPGMIHYGQTQTGDSAGVALRYALWWVRQASCDERRHDMSKFQVDLGGRIHADQ